MTKSTKLLSVIVAVAIVISTALLPTLLASSPDASFMSMLDSAGIHFYIYDDAVAPYASDNQLVPQLFAILSERDTHLKYHWARVCDFLPLDYSIAAAHSKLMPMSDGLSSKPMSPTIDAPQSSLCTFLI